MKKLLALILGLAMLQTVAKADDDKPVNFSQLPQKAQAFIKTHFSVDNISYAKMESDFFDKTYDVYFTNGDKVEFDKKGEWKDVECKTTAVPTAIIPDAINAFLKANHSDAKVIKIEINKGETERYEVKLSDRKELKFDKNYKFLRYDY